jgi:hypothetical protein
LEGHKGNLLFVDHLKVVKLALNLSLHLLVLDELMAFNADFELAELLTQIQVNVENLFQFFFKHHQLRE